jgi:hypothetical protein
MLIRGNNRLYRKGLTPQSGFQGGFLCRVFIQLCFVAFEHVDSLPDNEGILVPKHVLLTLEVVDARVKDSAQIVRSQSRHTHHECVATIQLEELTSIVLWI